ncbi:Putative ribonuclease H protein At1g65750 [Linum perenne]
MDQILIDFWWSGDISRKRLHWLSADELRKPVSDGGLGFRCFYDFNLAFIAKLAWRILTNPDHIWVQLLKGLYFPHSNFLQAAKHHRSSWIWTGVLEGRKALLQGLRKNIGDGHGTEIAEAWIPEAVGFKASCLPSFSSTKVSEFILNPGRIWNTAKLRSIFPEYVVCQILLIQLGPEGYSDQYVCHFESSGKFSVKSCYQRLRSQSASNNHPIDESSKKLWKWLWQLDLPPKVCFFIWRICRNALPTKVGLLRRRCGSSSICHTCHAEEETLEHLLFHCPLSMSFWQANMPSLQCPTPTQSVKSWFINLASTATQTSATEVGFTLWYIWKMRNELLFQDIQPSLTDLSARRAHDLQQWISVHDVRRNSASRVSDTRSSSFHLTDSLVPTMYSHKIVCDGAFKASIQKGTYGVILYNIQGKAVNGQAGSFKCAAPLCAEARAVLIAVQMAKMITTPTDIDSDFLILVNALRDHHHNWPWQISGILATLQQLLFWNQQIRVSYVPRSSVQAAHHIAIQARDNVLPPDWLTSV